MEAEHHAALDAGGKTRASERCESESLNMTRDQECVTMVGHVAALSRYPYRSPS